MTLEQYESELCRSTYLHAAFFFQLKPGLFMGQPDTKENVSGWCWSVPNAPLFALLTKKEQLPTQHLSDSRTWLGFSHIILLSVFLFFW